MIVIDKENCIFTLHTRRTTYQMKADLCGVLLHTYYGARVGQWDLSGLIQYTDRGFCPNPAETGHCRDYSLDFVPQEYSTSGVGDFRLPSVEAELEDGSRIVDLRYRSCEVRRGKYALDGLPAFYGEEKDADTLVLCLEDPVSRLRVELFYGVFEEYDLITRAVRVVNGGNKTARLRRAASLCLDLPRGDLDFITFDGRHTMERCPSRAPLRPGVQSVGSIRGTSSHQHNPFVILCQRDAGEDYGLCYGAMLLYSGSFEAAAERSQFEDTRLTMGISPHQFRYILAPGESFTAPEAAMVCSPDGLTPMSHRFHRAIRAHLLRDVPGQPRKPALVNSWEAAHFDFNADKLVALAEQAAQLGAELFVMDDGWFGARNDDLRSLGDWWVNETKLPGGLAALIARIRALGMDFGIWIEPEMVSEDSQLYREHPDWALGAPGRPRSRGRSQLVLDFSRPEVRDYIYKALRPALSCEGVTYVKWDMNRSLTEVWSAALPAERQGEVCHRYVLGVYDMLERIRRDYPHILLESCSGGGGRFDGGMLYYTPQIWCSDNTDAIDRLHIQYGTSFCYPVCTMGAHVSAVPNEQTRRVTPLETRGVTAMSGAFGYEMDLNRLTPEEKQLAARQIQTYKRHRSLIHGGDYYRLSVPGEGPFTAWAHVSSDRREALVSLVTGSVFAAPPFTTLRLKGLDPAARYRVNDGASVWPGDVLMQAGYPVPRLMGDYRSLQLYFKAE